MEITSVIAEEGIAERGREFSIGDAKFTIAQADNLNFRRKLRKLSEPHSASLMLRQPIPVEVWNGIEMQAAAGTILLGWSGMTKDGQPFPYSDENAEYLLRNAPMIRRAVFRIAEDDSLFTKAVIEAAKDSLATKSPVAS